MIMKNPQTNLPPGFRFHPTDEELVLHYLRKKATSLQVPVSIIADVDIYKFDPWDLPGKALFGEKEWYFFSPRDRKYPNGARPNRAAASGYWKATGTDKAITANIGGRLQENIGVKKALVFYKGRPPKGAKTNWIMHEYRLAETLNSNRNNNSNIVGERGFKSKKSSMRLDDWVLCRIYKKTYGSASSPDTNAPSTDQEHEEEQIITQETPLPNPTNCPPVVFSNTLKPQKSCSFSNLLDTADFSLLSSFLLENPSDQMGFEFPLMTGSTNFEQPFFGNFVNSSDGFLDQKLPHVSSLSPKRSESDTLKRQRLDFDDHTMNPSKKILSSCGYNNTVDQSDHSMAHHYSFLSDPFLNQKLISSPHLQFQG